MAQIDLKESIRPLSEFSADEVELQRDIHTAVGQVERGEGIGQEEARRLAHEGLRD